MITIREFTSDDIRDLPFCELDPMRGVAEHVVNMGAGLVAEYQGRDVAIGGISRLWPGVGEAWVCAESGLPPISFHRIARSSILSMAKKLQLHRVQVHSFIEDKNVHRWMEMLGFKREGIRKGWFFDGRDAEAFVLLFPGNIL